ncbi:MAG: hypothetical protein KAQ72_17545 [Desulfobacula sp.]|nr:hypothetical protein [Desulfobacula sp.]
MTKKRIFWLSFSVIIFIFLFRIYVHSDKENENNYDQTRTIKDMKGRIFAVADPIKRITLLGGPTGQVAFILGVQDRLCAVTNTLIKNI